MVSLVDIGPLTKTLQFRGEEVKVQGVAADALFHMLAQYPEMRMLMSGSYQPSDIVSGLFQIVPGVIGDIIAAGLGHAGNEKEAAGARALTIGEQFEFVKAIVDVTFPGGIASFVEGLRGLAQGVDARGWGQATRSPAQSNSALKKDTTNNAVGSEPLDNSQVGSS